MLHSRYRQLGGEDLSCRTEVLLLRDYGHEVIACELENETASGMQLGLEALGMSSGDRVRALLKAHEPDVIHLQNIWPRWGPAALSAVRRSGVPAVAAVRNYRAFCPAGTMFRSGHQCADCSGRIVAWPAVLHRCYRQSAAQSAVAAASMFLQSWRGIHLVPVSHYVATAIIRAGVAPRAMVHVKPNCVYPDPGSGPGSGSPVFVYVGRLEAEKGMRTLLEAWRLLSDDAAAPRLLVIGAGPLQDEIEDSRLHYPLSYLGPLPHESALEAIGQATALVQPAEWPEPFGRTVIEALAKGTPSIAAHVGGLPETMPALLFEPGDAAGLAQAVRRMINEPEWAVRRRKEARARYLRHFSGAATHERLMQIYAAAGAKTAEIAA